MEIGKFTTSITSGTTGVDSGGEVVSSAGYTAQVTERDRNGKYVFDKPKEVDPESEDCYAKESLFKNSQGEERKRYYIKHNSHGTMFNPWGMFDEGTHAQYDKNRGKLSWTFKEVSKQCFDFYCRFLQSKNSAWFKNAEREKN